MQIKHKTTGAVIREVDGDSLRWANLSEADLRWADLSGANLSEAAGASSQAGRVAKLEGYLSSALHILTTIAGCCDDWIAEARALLKEGESHGN